MLTQVILPTLITGISFIGISSISKEGTNFVNVMREQRRKLDGKPVFRTVVFPGECENCELAGRKCYHNRDPPKWHSADRMDDLEDMYQGFEDDYDAEMLNKVGDGGVKAAFDIEGVNGLLDSSNTYKLEHEFREFFVACDPACGGDKSRNAVVSSVFDHGEVMVVSNFIVSFTYSSQLI